jgi:hypothetical protein
MNDQGTDGKLGADQLGHTLDVNQNVYTRAAFDRQAVAVNKLDGAGYGIRTRVNQLGRLTPNH